MPTYQYACTDCGHGFEAVQSFTDATLTECPRCQGRLRKVFNSVGIVFKGSGFYRNDSREKATTGAKSEGKSGGEGKSDTSAGSSDGGKKTEPKADSKATAKPSSPTGSSTAGSAA
ncbi:MAG: FmdB family zinc ribbon protein [Actinomycetes bacterium]